MKQKPPSAAATAGLALAYALAAKLGLSLAVIDPAVSAVWPSSAIALGALLVLGTRTGASSREGESPLMSRARGRGSRRCGAG